MRPLERLIGMKLLDAKVSADGAGFQFSDCALAAFNPVSLSKELSEIINSEVCAVSFQENQHFELKFSNDSAVAGAECNTVIELKPEHHAALPWHFA